MDNLKSQILEFLKGKNYIAGGVIEDYMRTTPNHPKGETTSRLLRFLMEDEKLENTYIPREKGRPYVAYRIKLIDKLF